MPLFLQIGDGVFLRGFAEPLFEVMNGRLGFGARVAILKARPGAFSPAYGRQKNRYAVVSRGLRLGAPVRELLPIGCIESLVDPFTDWDRAIRIACDGELIALLSNTTEAGLIYREEKLPAGPGSTWPARIAQLLHARWAAFCGDRSKGLLVMPFELLEGNGRILEDFVLRHARAWYADAAFESWLQESCCFAGTLVDRIVSGFDAAERETMRKESGLDDELLVVAEPYSFLAVEAPPEWEERFPARRAGLNVIWERDISAFRTRKVHLLNGAHTLLALTARGLGMEIVREAMADPLCKALVSAWYREVLAVLPGSPEGNLAFSCEVTDRLANPGLDHRLESIALNSWAKFRSRILPVIRMARETSVPASVPGGDRGPFSPIGALALASLIHRYTADPPPRDDPAVVDAFRAIANQGGSARARCEAVLSDPALWKEGLPEIEGLLDAVAVSLGLIEERGLRDAISALVERPRAVRAIRLHAGDSVAVLLSGAAPGTDVFIEDPDTRDERSIVALESIPLGHKIALMSLNAGDRVVKYGYPIGLATAAIPVGAWVHGHNLSTSLSGEESQTSVPANATSVPGAVPAPSAPGRGSSWQPPSTEGLPQGFPGYIRPDGQVGIRNEIWILPTVGCVNKTAENLAREARERLGIPVYAFTHPYGCSQLGGDLAATRDILCGLAHNPNAGGVLFLALGCENNRLEELLPALGPYDGERVRFLTLQDVDDEIHEGLSALADLADILRRDKRVAVPLSSLRVGVKCGGSDGFSGLTANPLVGRVSDLVCAAGGSVVFTEVPETFGAEEVCIGHAVTEAVGTEVARTIADFKAWFIAHGQGLAENPSPGNREGGITTLEEKSLGCVRKAGSAPIVAVLPYAGRCRRSGVAFVSAPGNDLVSSTALVAAGCQLVLFTTGRGTPFGVPVPTLKIASNSDLARRKSHWIDYNAGVLLEGQSYESATRALMSLIIRVLGGEETKNEISGHREIAILKDGVTL